MVGLGGMGSAAAAALAERGARVTGFEQFSPAHDRGSSHGDSRIVRQAYFEDPAYVPLVRRAYEGWERLSADAGEPMVTWSGALMIGRPDADVVAGTLASVRSWDLPHEVLDQRAMAQRFPPFRLEPDEVAVFEPRAGFVRPEVAVRAQLARARRAGAELHFGAPIEGWQLAGDGVTVHVGGVEHHGDRLVITAGPWTSKVLADCGLPLAVKRAVMYQFEPTGSIELFAADRLPSYVFEFAPGRHGVRRRRPRRRRRLGAPRHTRARSASTTVSTTPIRTRSIGWWPRARCRRCGPCWPSASRCSPGAACGRPCACTR